MGLHKHELELAWAERVSKSSLSLNRHSKQSPLHREDYDELFLETHDFTQINRPKTGIWTDVAAVDIDIV